MSEMNKDMELRKIVTDALVSMVSRVTGLVPPSGPGQIPDFIQAPIDRAVEKISASLPVGVPDDWRRAIYQAEECLTGCLAAPDIARSLDADTVRKIIADLQSARFGMLAAVQVTNFKKAQPEVAENTGSHAMANQLQRQGLTVSAEVDGAATPGEASDADDRKCEAPNCGCADAFCKAWPDQDDFAAPTVKESLTVAPTVKAEQVGMADAYVGAREDLSIWKRRALEAEQKVRRQEQIIDHLTLEAQGETRFGEPSILDDEPVAVIEYAGYDPANSIKWLNKGLQYMEPGTLLYAQSPSLPAAGSADQPYPDGIADDLERSEWTPLEALQWYATGKHFDVVGGRTRIIDTGAVASNALKHASLDHLELKGDAELSELRAALSAQQSAPEQVSVPVELAARLQRFCERPHSSRDEADALDMELRALIASHQRGEA